MATTSKKVTSLFQKYEKELSNPIALVLKAAGGVDMGVFDGLLQITDLSKQQLASFIDATPKTIDNYRTRKRSFGRMESEQLLQILNLYKKGLQIFGSSDTFNQWLTLPAFGLGDREPIELLYTQGGINLVVDELIRIEYGTLG
jgi:putative toxin-antitoxin system antitoxin component (TIGR02293 family)